jgi:hypothetical protein
MERNGIGPEFMTPEQARAFVDSVSGVRMTRVFGILIWIFIGVSFAIFFVLDRAGWIKKYDRIRA